MKKIIILFNMIMIPTLAFAKFPLLNFEGLSGDYNDKKGTAFAEMAKYEISNVKISHQKIEVQFDKPEKHLVLKDDTTTVELGFDFSFLNIFRAVSFSGVDLLSNEKKFNVLMDNLNIYIDPNEYRISGVDVLADLTKINDVGDDIDILDAFMINGDINISEINFGAIEQKRMISDLVLENPSLNEEALNKFITAAKLPLVARNLRLVVRKETFSGSVKLDSWINLNLYLGGTVTQIEAEKKLVINLLKAKLGYVSIRSWILNSVRNLKLDNIVVDGTKIIIDLDKTILSSKV